MKSPLVITSTIESFDVSQILINSGSSCDIMYFYLFEKMVIERGSLQKYKGSNLHVFKRTNTHSRGYIELMVLVSKGKEILTVNSQFLPIHCRSIYSCILERSFPAMLDVVASLTHLKQKYHNLQENRTSSIALMKGKKESIKLSSETKEMVYPWRSTRHP